MPRRRGHGEGTTPYHRPDGRWESKVTLPNGRRQSFYGKTKTEAAAKRNDALRRLGGGQPPKESIETVGGFLTRWLEDVKRPKLAPGSYIDYAGAIRKHIAPALGDLRLTRLTAPAVQQFYGDLGRAGLSAGTIRKIHGILRAALDKAVAWDLVPRNVVARAAPPKVKRSQRPVFTPEQARTFLAAVRDTPLEALFVLAITSGLREGELLGLRWEDVDMERRTVTVVQALRRHYIGRALADPKSASGLRRVSVPDVAIASLRRHKAHQAEQRLRAAAWADQGLVFPGRAGRPYSPDQLRDYQFYPLLESAGLPRVYFHTLRHTFATLQLAEGTGLKVVSEMLGHSGIGVTADVYMHVSEDMQRQAADRLGSLLEESK